MQVDLITQEIWHFIAAFQQVTEAARQRIEYDKYAAQKALASKSDLGFLDVKGAAPHKLEHVDIGLRYVLKGDTANEAKLLPFAVDMLDPTHISLGVPADASPFIWGNSMADSAGDIVPFVGPSIGATVSYTLPPPNYDLDLPVPGSNAVVMAQWNHLTDSDILIHTDLGLQFVSFAAFENPMQTLVATAQALDVIGGHSAPSSVDDIKVQSWQTLEAVQAAVALDQTAGANDSGAQIALFHGEDATGTLINGAKADALPVFNDHLPTVPEQTALPGTEDWADQLVENGAPEPGHTVVAGGNTLINEVAIGASWMDAPVILVKGDALQLDVISQINVLHENSTVNGTMTVGLAADSPSQMFNIAQNMIKANPVAIAAEDVKDIFPSFWAVTTLDANLINLNWMQQQNFVMDHDIVSVSFSGNNSFLQMADNTLVNMASFLELGFGYDMIVIGGDMINMNLIRQMNVLFDSDWVSTGGLGADVQTGNNLLWNQAIINGQGQNSMVGMDDAYGKMADAIVSGKSGPVNDLVHDSTFHGIGTLNVLYISGDLMTVNMIDQSNILGDNDQVAVMAAAAAMQAGAEIQIVTGANALANIAAINTGGVDSVIHVAGDYYSDALLYQANLIDHTGIDPLANGPTALTSEAVLFLADGLIGDAIDDAAPIYNADHMSGGQLDGVNAVLA